MSAVEEQLAEALHVDAKRLRKTLNALGLVIRQKPKNKRSVSLPLVASQKPKHCERCLTPVEEVGHCVPRITKFVNAFS